jgi:HD-GYP domain-containing protein (c-di-GMP phosphodiesterase class II)
MLAVTYHQSQLSKVDTLQDLTVAGIKLRLEGAAMDALIQVMESTIAARDPYTVSHQQRVTQIACAIAKEMEVPEDRIQQLRIAATLHDLGKVAIPTELLARPGKLSSLEFDLIKTHPQVAYNILQPLNLPGDTAEIILQHHERLDGSGYPQGLKEPDILLEARILGVADVMEAMCSHRPYRPALDPAVALAELSMNKGVLYDVAVVDACLKLYGDNLPAPQTSYSGLPPRPTTIIQSLAPIGDFAQDHINLAHLSRVPETCGRKPWKWARIFSKDRLTWVPAGTVSNVGLLLVLFSRGF